MGVEYNIDLHGRDNWRHQRRKIILHRRSTSGFREERCDIKKIRDDANEAKLKGLVKDLGELDRLLVIRSKT